MSTVYNPSFITLWLKSYHRDAQHALKDAHTNLKGFTRVFNYYLQKTQVDKAFELAIRRCI